MDINSILPFLMTGDKGNSDMSQIMQMLNNGNLDETALMTKLMEQNGTNPQAAKILSMANNMKKNSNKKAPPSGVRPIQNFVSDDIMGKIVKYFNSKPRST